MTKEWLCVFSASGLVLAGYVFYKIREYKTEQEVKQIMFRTKNGVNSTYSSSALFVDEGSKKFYIAGANKVYHALDYSGYVLKGKAARISVTEKDYNVRLKNQNDVVAFEECCRVLGAIKEEALKEAGDFVEE